MLGGTKVEFLDDIGSSAICELSNIIMGRVSTEFSMMNVRTDITPPSLIKGSELLFNMPRVTVLSIKFKNERGEVEVDVAVQ